MRTTSSTNKFLKAFVKPSKDDFQWNLRVIGNPQGLHLLWLHGFMGQGEDWLPLVQNHFTEYCNILIDLPGHGENILGQTTEFSKILQSLSAQLRDAGFQKFIPIGYSMGGRFAFHLHKFIPEPIKALILLSSAPGLKSRAEQKERVLQDRQLMDKLEQTDFSVFLQDWYSTGLFGKIRDNATLFAHLCQSRTENAQDQLRASLELMGNGALPSLWTYLQNISIPTLLLTGEMDVKYFQLNEEIHKDLPGSQHHQVEDAGHAFHLEKPLETARVIRHFLRETIKGD